MALDLVSPMNRLVTLLKTISGLEDVSGVAYVKVGVPASAQTRLMAYVALADFPDLGEPATQAQDVLVPYAVGFFYRVAGAEPTAEEVLCATVAAWLDLMKRPVNRKLNNGSTDLVADARVRGLGTGRPGYGTVAGQEVRLVESLVMAKMRQVY